MHTKTTNHTYNNYLFFSLLLTGHIILIWVLPYFPTQDGPSHIYNLAILNDLVHDGKVWSKYYTMNFRLVPNLGFHMIAFPLLQIWSPMVTEKIFITIYIILLGSGYLYFLHSFEKPLFPFAYFVLPAIFNFTLLMGFYSYIIAIPIYMVGLAIQWRIRNSNTITRFLIINIFGVLLFLFHLIPFCLYIISTLLILWVNIEPNLTTKHFLKHLILILPCILILLFYLWNNNDVYQLSQMLHQNGTTSGSIKSILLRKLTLICELFLFSTDTFSRWQLIPASIFGFLVVCFSYESLKKLLKKAINHEKLSPIINFFLLQNIILFGIYLLAPFRLGSGSFFNERMPWVILLFLIPVLTIPDRLLNKKINPIIIMTIIIFLFVNTIVFNKESKKVQNFLAGLKIEMPQGSFLMTYKNSNPTWSRVDSLLHVGSYFGIKKKCVDIGNYQTGATYFLIKFTENLPKLPTLIQIENDPGSIELNLYPSIQYILGYHLSEFDKEKLLNYFNMIFSNDMLSIWQQKTIRYE